MLKVAWMESSTWRISIMCATCAITLREACDLAGIAWRQRGYDGPAGCARCGQLSFGLNTV